MRIQPSTTFSETPKDSAISVRFRYIDSGKVRAASSCISQESDCGECDDANPLRHPTAFEVCNAIDDDCDGIVPPIEFDGDADGLPACAGDCDDTTPTISARVVEVCGDGMDNNCDGTDEPCVVVAESEGCGCNGAPVPGGAALAAAALAATACRRSWRAGRRRDQDHTRLR